MKASFMNFMESRSRFKSKGCALCGYAQEPRLDLYRPILPKHSPNMTVRRENGTGIRSFFQSTTRQFHLFWSRPFLVRSFVVKRREEDCLYDDTGRQDLTAVARGRGREAGWGGAGERRTAAAAGAQTPWNYAAVRSIHPSMTLDRDSRGSRPDGDRRGGNRVSPMEEKRAARRRASNSASKQTMMRGTKRYGMPRRMGRKWHKGGRRS